MLTRLVIRNFKLFEQVELELGDRVVLIGPNNSGKTSAIQALVLWSIGVRRWIEKRGAGTVPEKRPNGWHWWNAYVLYQLGKARDHFYGLREAKPDLVGIAIYDRLDKPLPPDTDLLHTAWRHREIENYLCCQDALLAFTADRGQRQQGELFGVIWRDTMVQALSEIEAALAALNKPSPWGPDIKASDDFLNPLFSNFYKKLALPNLMRKTDYHELAPFLPATSFDPEIAEKLDVIVEIALKASSRED